MGGRKGDDRPRIDYTKSLGLPKDGNTPSRRRAGRRRQHQAKQAPVRADIVTRQHYVCIGWGLNPKCQHTIHHPHHVLRQSWAHENSGDIEVGVCVVCHDAIEDGHLVFYWVGDRPNCAARPGQPGHVTVQWIGPSRNYRPKASGYRRPDVINEGVDRGTAQGDDQKTGQE